VVAERR